MATNETGLEATLGAYNFGERVGPDFLAREAEGARQALRDAHLYCDVDDLFGFTQPATMGKLAALIPFLCHADAMAILTLVGMLTGWGRIGAPTLGEVFPSDDTG